MTDVRYVLGAYNVRSLDSLNGYPAPNTETWYVIPQKRGPSWIQIRPLARRKRKVLSSRLEIDVSLELFGRIIHRVADSPLYNRGQGAREGTR